MGFILHYFNQYIVNKPKKILTFLGLLSKLKINTDDANLMYLSNYLKPTRNYETKKGVNFVQSTRNYETKKGVNFVQSTRNYETKKGVNLYIHNHKTKKGVNYVDC